MAGERSEQSGCVLDCVIGIKDAKNDIDAPRFDGFDREDRLEPSEPFAAEPRERFVRSRKYRRHVARPSARALDMNDQQSLFPPHFS